MCIPKVRLNKFSNITCVSFCILCAIGYLSELIHAPTFASGVAYFLLSLVWFMNAKSVVNWHKREKERKIEKLLVEEQITLRQEEIKMYSYQLLTIKKIFNKL